MDRKALVQELIAATAPVFIRKTLKYLAAGKSPSDDEIVRAVIEECEEVEVDIGASSMINDEPKYAGPYGSLVSTIHDVIEDLIDDIKSQIKTELRMEFHMQIEALKVSIGECNSYGGNNNNNITKSNTDDAPIGGLMQFEVTDDTKIEGITSGYASIKKFNALEDNPLFKMVSKSVSNAERGLPTHSAEEYNAARANRTDGDTDRLIIEAEQKHSETIEDVESNDLWDKMFAERYGTK